jgi:hypothetical protein
MIRDLEDGTLDEYLKLKAQAKELEGRIKEMGAMITAELWDEPGNVFDHAGMTFAVGGRKSWTYSDELKAMQKQVAALKKVEEADGTATLKSHSSFLVVRKIKQ